MEPEVPGMRLTFVIPNMTAGGAQRVMATMANHWAVQGWEITLLTFDDGATPAFFPLDGRVRQQPLDLARPSRTTVQAVANTLRRIATLRRAITQSRPDAVISFLDTTNVTTLLATRVLGVPAIVEEHSDPSQQPLGKGWTTLRERLYPRAAKVVVLSEQARRYFAGPVGERVVVIPNPVEVAPPSRAPRAKAAGSKTLIALGRLSPEKGFDLLMSAFAEIAADRPEWRLAIWGEGPLRADLEALRRDLGLTGRVELPGRTANPHDELRDADLFVLSSRWEGFPMALGEAMACGVAAVSFDCESGPRQLIRTGIDGVLVPPENTRALASTLDWLMTDDLERARLARRAPEVLERYGVDAVMGVWETMLDEIAAGRRARRFGIPGAARA
jgi:glycosyltransferase involved in cell wall biosynthesis